jgi:adenylate cyclase
MFFNSFFNDCSDCAGDYQKRINSSKLHFQRVNCVQWLKWREMMLGINVFNRGQHEQVVCKDEVVWVGSADCDVPAHVKVNDPLVLGKHLAIRRCDEDQGTIELVNHGRTVLLTSGLRVFRGVEKKLKLPVEFWIGESFICIFKTENICPIDYAINILPAALYASANGSPDTQGQTEPQRPTGGVDLPSAAPSAATLSMWFDAFGQLQRSIAGSQSFFSEAARSVFDPGGLDAGILLLKENETWMVAANYIPNPELGTTFRPDLIERVAREKATLFHDTNRLKKNSVGGDYSAVVVSPVFGSEHDVIGVVYGLRGQHRKNHRRGVRPMEAHFVQLVAEAVSAGLIRMEREAEAARDKVLLNQAFSPEVVQHISAHPESLAGQNREVSVLFADIRNYSEISDRIGSRMTFQLLSDIMDAMTNTIAEHHGVIIDYYGDGIAAFWNAPITQYDHASLACSAALAMLKKLPEINEKWAQQIGQFVRIGIGINTGEALVGNSGSKRRIKYGPRGTTVNIASRIESFTKQVGAPLLVNASTATQAGEKFLRCKIGTVALPGIAEPAELYRMFDPHMDVRELEKLRMFESAVENFERGELEDAKSKISALQEFSEVDPCVSWLLRQIDGSRSLGHSKDSFTNIALSKTT